MAERLCLFSFLFLLRLRQNLLYSSEKDVSKSIILPEGSPLPSAVPVKASLVLTLPELAIVPYAFLTVQGPVSPSSLRQK